MPRLQCWLDIVLEALLGAWTRPLLSLCLHWLLAPVLRQRDLSWRHLDDGFLRRQPRAQQRQI